MSVAHRAVFAVAVALALVGVTSAVVVDAAGTDEAAAAVPAAAQSSSSAASRVTPEGVGSDRDATAPDPAGPATRRVPDSTPGATAEEAGTGAPRTGAAEMNTGDLPIEVSVAPGCATLGQKLVAQVKAVPGAYVSLVVAYADGRNYGEMYAGPVGPDGSLTYPWVPPPAAATGQGRVLVAGHDPAAETSGTGGAFFLIEGASGC